jgi:hypothetical protein
VIETVLIFLAGVLAAGLLALLLMPAVNARAVRLYRRRLDHELPRSMAEMIAAKDAIRAEMAARMARVEVELDIARQAVAAAEARSAADRALAKTAEAERAAFAATVDDYERRLEEARSVARFAHEAVARVDAERRDLQRQLSMRASEAEESRDEAESLAADMRMALVEAEARIAMLSETVAEFASTNPSSPLGGAAEPSTGAPVIHVDFVTKTEKSPDKTQAKAPEPPVEAEGDEDARIDDLAQRLRLLRARNAVARQRIESALAKGMDTPPDGDSPHSVSP